MQTNNFSKTQCITLTGMFGAIIFMMTFTPLGFPQIPLIGSATIVHIPVIVGAILMGPKYGAVLGFMFGLSSMIFASTQSLALNAFAFTPLRPVPGTDSGSPFSLLIAFVPRILVGVVAPLVFYALAKWIPKIPSAVNIVIAAVVASMTNTLLVLHMLFFIFREPWGYARAASAAGAREAAYTAYAQAEAAWQSAMSYATAASWDIAADFARDAVAYEAIAATESARVIVAPQITYGFIAGIIATFGVPEAILAGILAPAICVPLFMVAKQIAARRGAKAV
ncbi:MAG: ECF transporter S component [Defluviitaleaceae bacterium]|nr:ECF transporter S component [Defluviitaleaceae bacterium]